MSVTESKAKTERKSSRKPAKTQETVLSALLAQTEEVSVPLASLIKSPLNVRTVPYSAESVSELADSIKGVGLLQNLVVHALPGDRYGVAAGGRRLAALNMLAERDIIQVDWPVRVKVIPQELATAASMTENGHRRDMHPAEQIAGFRAMAQEGKTPAQIGDLLGYSPRHVQRMLKLADLAPVILDALAEDRITTEHCQALALENDTARQVQVFEAACQSGWGGKPDVRVIRNLITESEVAVKDNTKFRFVGADAFSPDELRTDLFSDDEGGYVDCVALDAALLEKLQAVAEHLREAEGWEWCAGRMEPVGECREDSRAYRNLPEPEPVGINTTRQIAAAQQEMAREASNRAESALHGFSSSIASAWNTLSQFGSNRGSSDSVTGGVDSTMSAQDSMMASRMRSAVESYAKAHNISNEQATQELASRSTRASAGMYGDAHAEWGVKPKILGVGGGLGVRGGGRAGIDWSDDDAHQASSGSRASYDARHDIDAKASKDFKEASDYFTSRKVSESGSHTDNNADSRVDQLSAALNSAKQSYDQYTTNMTRSHEYAEMASRTESMSGQMSEDLSQQFAQYVMKHAPQDAEAILTNTSSPEIAERRRAMAWSFVQEQIQPGVDNAWRESRGDIGKGMESVPSGGGSQDIIADHQGHQAIIEQRTQDSNIRNDVKHQVDNMVTEYKGNIGDTQNSIRGEENIVRGQYSELQNHHKTEALSQNNKYNEEKSAQERMPGADSPQELMKRAKEYQDKYKQ